MKEIPLTRGFVALVDDEDFDHLSQYRWSVDSDGYAIARFRQSGKGSVRRMHRVVLSAPARTEIDHIDRNKLNNCKSNLRICTQSQNTMNRPPIKNTSSSFKGVSWQSRDKRWVAAIWINKRLVVVCRCKSEVEAARAYDAAAREHFGEFAYLNFPDTEQAA